MPRGNIRSRGYPRPSPGGSRTSGAGHGARRRVNRPALVPVRRQKEDVPKQDHRELSLRALESRFEPGPLPVVEAPEDTGVAGDEGETLAVYFEEWRPLEAGLLVVLPPQLGGL